MTTWPAGTFWDSSKTEGEANSGWFQKMLTIGKEMPGGAEAIAELTIALGIVTPTTAAHTVDTESDASTDDLNNIVITNMTESRRILLRAENATRDVVLKHLSGGSGQISLLSGKDFTLNDADRWVEFILVGTTWYEVSNSGSETSIVKSPQRSVFIFKDVDEIYLGGAVYFHSGTKDQQVYWDSQLTYQFTNLAASDWSYLYLDDSAIVTSGSPIITASQLIDSTTEPVWSDAKKGWYNGEDRCIFAVLTDGSSQIFEFNHDGEKVAYATAVVDLSDANTGTTFANAALTAPSFANRISVTFDFSYVDGGAIIFYRPDTSVGGGDYACYAAAAAARQFNTIDVIAVAQTIEIKESAATANTVSIYTGGWHFPVGM